METLHNPTLAELQEKIAILEKENEELKNNSLYKKLYKENIDLEAQVTQKGFIIDELKEQLQEAEEKAKNNEKYYLQELTNKLKVCELFYNLKKNIEELQKVGAIEF